MQIVRERLKEFLIKEMRGIQKLLAVLFQNPTDNLDEPFLQHHEILNNEPLHDVSKYLWGNSQPPSKRFQAISEKIIHNSFNGKEVKNTSNYRESLLILCIWLTENHPGYFPTEIITTLIEIQGIICNWPAQKSSSILCFQNICFKHAMLLEIHLQGCLKSPTSHKLLGSYYHFFIIHAPQQFSLS